MAYFEENFLSFLQNAYVNNKNVRFLEGRDDAIAIAMLSKKILSHTSSSSAMRQHPLSSCGDCGAPGPLWAAINRGILLCSDCCSVHRSLGRHVSQIKCAKAGSGAVWVPEQLTMVQSLFSCGANSIWEYSLLNPAENESNSSSSLPTKSAEYAKMRKPRQSDPLHPQKSDFIRAKHLHHAFVFRPASKEVMNGLRFLRLLLDFEIDYFCYRKLPKLNFHVNYMEL